VSYVEGTHTYRAVGLLVQCASEVSVERLERHTWIECVLYRMCSLLTVERLDRHTLHTLKEKLSIILDIHSESIMPATHLESNSAACIAHVQRD
jgi:hypothetical protein